MTDDEICALRERQLARNKHLSGNSVPLLELLADTDAEVLYILTGKVRPVPAAEPAEPAADAAPTPG